MTTKNITPRATGEGQVGTSSKKWNEANFVSGSFDTLTVNGQSITGEGSSTLTGLSDTNISTPLSGQILVYDGTDSFDNVTLSGDATINASGDLTIADLSVTNAMLEGSIDNTKLLNSAVTLNGNSLALGGTLTLDTDDIGEGSNLYYTNARFDTQLATKDSDDISEGSTNQYFTDARADSRIAAADLTDLSDVDYTAGAGIDGYVLTYSNSNSRWEAQAASGGGGGSSNELHTTITSSGTLSNGTSDNQIFVLNGTSLNISLPTSVSNGVIYNIKNINSTQVTLTGKIDSTTSTNIYLSAYDNITIIKYNNSEEWLIL